jgi:hypothetical protein
MKEQTLEKTIHQKQKTHPGGNHPEEQAPEAYQITTHPPDDAGGSHKRKFEYKPWHHEGYKWQKPENWRQPRTAYHKTELEAPIAKQNHAHHVEHINTPTPCGTHQHSNSRTVLLRRGLTFTDQGLPANIQREWNSITQLWISKTTNNRGLGGRIGRHLLGPRGQHLV